MEDWKQVEKCVKDKRELQHELLMVQQQFELVKHGRFLPGKCAIKHRDWNDGYQRILNDCFSIDPMCDVNDFWRKFCMSKQLFLKVVMDIQEYDPYFK
jgi:hypothetical protein